MGLVAQRYNAFENATCVSFILMGQSHARLMRLLKSIPVLSSTLNIHGHGEKREYVHDMPVSVYQCTPNIEK